MISIHNKQGKLYEIRVLTPVTFDEFGALIRQITAPASSSRGTYRGIVDVRGCTVTSGELADAIARFLASDNPIVERSAILAGNSSATFNLQLGRMVKASRSTRRRLFNERVLAEAWMEEILTPLETQRMKDFFDENEIAMAALNRA